MMRWTVKSAPQEDKSRLSPSNTPTHDSHECLHGIWKAYASSNSDELDSNDLTEGACTKVEQDVLACLDRCKDARSNPSSEQQLLPLKPLDEVSALNSIHAFPCKDTYKALPSHPSQWPQAPLMIRPTPYTSTKVRGIRRVGSLAYEHFAGFCAGCILPINCGCEALGESLVIDFESTHFVGTLLLRIKQAKSSHNTQPSDHPSYFDGKKRKFQAIVKGRFLHPLPMNETVTGQTFDRPAGKLPARWIVTPFVKFISTLAPQLEAKLDGASPRFLTPLVATAQTVIQNQPMAMSSMATDLENEVEELPSTDPASLLPLAQKALGVTTGLDTTSHSTAARMKARKHAFNQLAARKDKTLTFDTSKQYTFEFYQHLLDFGDEGLAIDMGQPIGKVGLSRPLDGQPIKFMSAHKDPLTGKLDTLWSFDIWHASLYPYAETALTATNGTGL